MYVRTHLLIKHSYPGTSPKYQTGNTCNYVFMCSLLAVDLNREHSVAANAANASNVRLIPRGPTLRYDGGSEATTRQHSVRQ